MRRCLLFAQYIYLKSRRVQQFIKYIHYHSHQYSRVLIIILLNIWKSHNIDVILRTEIFKTGIPLTICENSIQCK